VTAPKYALVLRTCKANGSSYGGFRWPVSGPVECRDWRPTPECGHGLHGLLWGIGDHSLLSRDATALWQVVRVLASEVMAIDALKVKFPRGEVVCSGTAAEAIAYIAAHGAIKHGAQLFSDGEHEVTGGAVLLAGTAKLRAVLKDGAKLSIRSCGSSTATVRSYDSSTATVESCDSSTATVRSYGSSTATVRSCDSSTATVESCGSSTATVESCGSSTATVESCGSSTLICREVLYSWQHAIDVLPGAATGKGVILDRSHGPLRVYAAVPVTAERVVK
jgi:hypothetical protein